MKTHFNGLKKIKLDKTKQLSNLKTNKIIESVSVSGSKILNIPTLRYRVPTLLLSRNNAANYTKVKVNGELIIPENVEKLKIGKMNVQNNDEIEVLDGALSGTIFTIKVGLPLNSIIKCPELCEHIRKLLKKDSVEDITTGYELDTITWLGISPEVLNENNYEGYFYGKVINDFDQFKKDLKYLLNLKYINLAGSIFTSELKLSDLPKMEVYDYSFVDCKTITNVILDIACKSAYKSFKNCSSIVNIIFSEDFSCENAGAIFEECIGINELTLHVENEKVKAEESIFKNASISALKVFEQTITEFKGRIFDDALEVSTLLDLKNKTGLNNLVITKKTNTTIDTLLLDGSDIEKIDLSSKNSDFPNVLTISASDTKMLKSIKVVAEYFEKIDLSNSNILHGMFYHKGFIEVLKSKYGLNFSSVTINDKQISSEDVEKIKKGSFAFLVNSTVLINDGPLTGTIFKMTQTDTIPNIGMSIESIFDDNNVAKHIANLLKLNSTKDFITLKDLKTITAFGYAEDGKTSIFNGVEINSWKGSIFLTELKKITISGSICNDPIVDLKYSKKIESLDSAFENCSELQSVIFPDLLPNLKSATKTYTNCIKLKNNSLESLRMASYIDQILKNTSFTNIDISNFNNILSMNNSFENCKNLQKLKFPQKMDSLINAIATIKDCSSLRILKLPESMENTSNMTDFSKGTILRKLTIPCMIGNGSTNFDNAFSENSDLYVIYLENPILFDFEDISIKFKNVKSLDFSNLTELAEIKITEENKINYTLEELILDNLQIEILDFNKGFLASNNLKKLSINNNKVLFSLIYNGNLEELSIENSPIFFNSNKCRANYFLNLSSTLINLNYTSLDINGTKATESQVASIKKNTFVFDKASSIRINDGLLKNKIFTINILTELPKDGIRIIDIFEDDSISTDIQISANKYNIFEKITQTELDKIVNLGLNIHKNKDIHTICNLNFLKNIKKISLDCNNITEAKLNLNIFPNLESLIIKANSINFKELIFSENLKNLNTLELISKTKNVNPINSLHLNNSKLLKKVIIDSFFSSIQSFKINNIVADNFKFDIKNTIISTLLLPCINGSEKQNIPSRTSSLNFLPNENIRSLSEIGYNLENTEITKINLNNFPSLNSIDIDTIMNVHTLDISNSKISFLDISKESVINGIRTKKYPVIENIIYNNASVLNHIKIGNSSTLKKITFSESIMNKITLLSGGSKKLPIFDNSDIPFPNIISFDNSYLSSTQVETLKNGTYNFNQSGQLKIEDGILKGLIIEIKTLNQIPENGLSISSIFPDRLIATLIRNICQKPSTDSIVIQSDLDKITYELGNSEIFKEKKITSIGGLQFLRNLTRISFEGAIFELDEFIVPESWKNISDFSKILSETKGIKKVKFLCEENIISTLDSAFKNSEIEKVIFPKKMNFLLDLNCCFEKCYMLSEIIFPTETKMLLKVNSMLSGTKKIKSITFGKIFEKVEKLLYVCRDSNIEEIKITEHMKNVRSLKQICCNCKKIKLVEISDKCTEIEDFEMAFSDATLTNPIFIFNSKWTKLRNINRMFENANGIREITIPETITSIEDINDFCKKSSVETLNFYASTLNITVCDNFFNGSNLIIDGYFPSFNKNEYRKFAKTVELNIKNLHLRRSKSQELKYKSQISIIPKNNSCVVRDDNQYLIPKTLGKIKDLFKTKAITEAVCTCLNKSFDDDITDEELISIRQFGTFDKKNWETWTADFSGKEITTLEDLKLLPSLVELNMKGANFLNPDIDLTFMKNLCFLSKCFSQTNIRTLLLPDSIMMIDKILANTSNIKKLIIPASVTKLRYFDECIDKSQVEELIFNCENCTSSSSDIISRSTFEKKENKYLKKLVYPRICNEFYCIGYVRYPNLEVLELPRKSFILNKFDCIFEKNKLVEANFYNYPFLNEISFDTDFLNRIHLNNNLYSFEYFRDFTGPVNFDIDISKIPNMKLINLKRSNVAGAVEGEKYGNIFKLYGNEESLIKELIIEGYKQITLPNLMPKLQKYKITFETEKYSNNMAEIHFPNSRALEELKVSGRNGDFNFSTLNIKHPYKKLKKLEFDRQIIVKKLILGCNMENLDYLSLCIIEDELIINPIIKCKNEIITNGLPKKITFLPCEDIYLKSQLPFHDINGNFMFPDICRVDYSALNFAKEDSVYGYFSPNFKLSNYFIKKFKILEKKESIKDLSIFTNLTNLGEMIDGVSDVDFDIQDWNWLKKMPNLKRLNLSGNRKIKTIDLQYSNINNFSHCFDNCLNLKKLKMPSNLNTKTLDNLLNNCINIEFVYLPPKFILEKTHVENFTTIRNPNLVIEYYSDDSITDISQLTYMPNEYRINSKNLKYCTNKIPFHFLGHFLQTNIDTIDDSDMINFISLDNDSLKIAQLKPNEEIINKIYIGPHSEDLDIEIEIDSTGLEWWSTVNVGIPYKYAQNLNLKLDDNFDRSNFMHFLIKQFRGGTPRNKFTTTIQPGEDYIFFNYNTKRTSHETKNTPKIYSIKIMKRYSFVIMTHSNEFEYSTNNPRAIPSAFTDSAINNFTSLKINGKSLHKSEVDNIKNGTFILPNEGYYNFIADDGDLKDISFKCTYKKDYLK